jgi:hypothetical protein
MSNQLSSSWPRLTTALERWYVEDLGEGAVITSFDGEDDRPAPTDAHHRAIREPDLAGDGSIEVSERLR